MRSEYLPNEKQIYDARMVGVFARGGQVFNNLSAMWYVVPELASWVGPIQGVVPQGGQVPQGA